MTIQARHASMFMPAGHSSAATNRDTSQPKIPITDLTSLIYNPDDQYQHDHYGHSPQVGNEPNPATARPSTSSSTARPRATPLASATNGLLRHETMKMGMSPWKMKSTATAAWATNTLLTAWATDTSNMTNTTPAWRDHHTHATNELTAGTQPTYFDGVRPMVPADPATKSDRTPCSESILEF